jgi:hypothetical protein
MTTNLMRNLAWVVVSASIVGPLPSFARPSDADLVMRNVDATHCEAFVEKGAVVFGNGQRSELRFYIKIHPERLDGAVKYVGFHAFKEDVSGICSGPSPLTNPYCAKVGIWSDYKSRPFVHESKDYFDVRIEASDIDGDMFSYEGVFFVQTDMGTRYWLHADRQSQNFQFAEDYIDLAIDRQCAFDQEDFDQALIPASSAVGLGLNPWNCY